MTLFLVGTFCTFAGIGLREWASQMGEQAMSALAEQRARYEFNWTVYRQQVDRCVEEVGACRHALRAATETARRRIDEASDVAAMKAAADGMRVESLALVAEAERIRAWQAGYIAQQKQMDAAGLRLSLGDR